MFFLARWRGIEYTDHSFVLSVTRGGIGMNTHALDGHNTMYTAYAVYRMIVGKGIVWYCFDTAQWLEYPDYTTQLDIAQRIANAHGYSSIVAVDIEVSNPRFI